jgi:hypothetical protein
MSQGQSSIGNQPGENASHRQAYAGKAKHPQVVVMGWREGLAVNLGE